MCCGRVKFTCASTYSVATASCICQALQALHFSGCQSCSNFDASRTSWLSCSSWQISYFYWKLLKVHFLSGNWLSYILKALVWGWERRVVLDWKLLKLDLPRSSSSVKLFKAAPCLLHLVRLVTLTPAPNDFSNWKSASPNDLSKCPTQNLHLYLPSLACWPWIIPKWLDQILRLLKKLSKILVKIETWNEMSNNIDSAGCSQTF